MVPRPKPSDNSHLCPNLYEDLVALTDLKSRRQLTERLGLILGFGWFF